MQGFVGNGVKCVDSEHSFMVLEDSETRAYTFISRDDGKIETDPSKVCGCNKPEKKGHCESSDCCEVGNKECNKECKPDGSGCQCKRDFVQELVKGGGLPGAWRCVDKTPPRVRLIKNPSGAFIPLGQRTHEVTVKQVSPLHSERRPWPECAPG